MKCGYVSLLLAVKGTAWDVASTEQVVAVCLAVDKCDADGKNLLAQRRNVGRVL